MSTQLTKYIRLAKSLLHIFEIDLDEYIDEFFSTSTKIYLKYRDSGTTLVDKHRNMLSELYSSVVNICYYIGDYVNTCEYTETTPLCSVNSLGEFEYILKLTRKFSIKTCDEYRAKTSETRILDSDYIKRMIVSEIYKFISFLYAFYSEYDYYDDYELFESISTLMDNDLNKEVDIPNLRLELKLFLNDGFNSRSSEFKSIFTSVHLIKMNEREMIDNLFDYLVEDILESVRNVIDDEISRFVIKNRI